MANHVLNKCGTYGIYMSFYVSDESISQAKSL